MNFLQRIVRHVSIISKNYGEPSTPPFLTLFINSICNMKCAHCFYWRSLNSKDDLTRDEIFELSRSLGKIENLSISGGEPFLRKEFAEICRQFISQNGVRQIYVPTNGFYTERTVNAIMNIIEEPELELFVVELSLDGMPQFHDEFRVTRNAFKNAMETYDALAKLQESEPRLRIHCISTATDRNMDEIQRLSTFLFERCPHMDHHNLAIIRGDRKDATLQGPQLRQYGELYEYIRRLWAPREEGRYGASVEPMLQWTKIETIQRETQFVPCTAGVLAGVVYANGDVSVCEIHEPIGNLRENSFNEIWNSKEAKELRASIVRKECWCTTEIFMWPSIVYQPTALLRVMSGAKVWQKTVPLTQEERVAIHLDEIAKIEEEPPDQLVQVNKPEEKM